jgi:hypothetical protein
VTLRRHGTSALLWAPALTAAVYLTTVSVLSVHLIRLVYWDTDVAAPLVLAERLRGEGPVYIGHFGSWSVLWTLLATRGLPGHSQLWEVMAYPFAVATACLLGWATARAAGRWAGVTAAAASLLVGPLALRSLLTVIYHVTTPFTAVVLGAYLVTLTRDRSRSLLVVGATAVGLLAGVNAASDPLLWAAGIGPFAIAAAALTAKSRNVKVALQAGVALAVTVFSAVATHLIMQRLDFHVIGLHPRVIGLRDLPEGIRHLARMIALLGGANYAVPGPYPHEPLRILIAVLFIGAVGATVIAALLYLARHAAPISLAYACYWAAAVILLCVSFVVTPNAVALGAGSMSYLLTLAPAAGAGLALLAAGSRRKQLAVAIAVVIIGAANIAGLIEGKASTAKGALGSYEPQIARLLESKRVMLGYAGYWDAQNLAWQSHMRLLVAPIERCGQEEDAGLCGFHFATIASWYHEHPGPSFLIVDPTTEFITRPPPIVHEATSFYRFGPLTVYVFPYDLARYIQTPHT